jgi:hypothetical protein
MREERNADRAEGGGDSIDRHRDYLDTARDQCAAGKLHDRSAPVGLSWRSGGDSGIAYLDPRESRTQAQLGMLRAANIKFPKRDDSLPAVP